MEHLEGALRPYPWGSHTLIAQLRGEPSPSPQPQAELWFGAHPAAPAKVNGQGLDEAIVADPAAALGAQAGAAKNATVDAATAARDGAAAKGKAKADMFEMTKLINSHLK